MLFYKPVNTLNAELQVTTICAYHAHKKVLVWICIMKKRKKIVDWPEISLGNWSGKILELKKGNRFFLFRTTEFQPKLCGNLGVDHAAAFVNNNV